MLLRTKVQAVVHELVGGMVEHVPCDEGGPESETTLLLQKLYSMNVLAYEGSLGG